MSQGWRISGDLRRELTPLRVLAVHRIAGLAASGAACAVLAAGCSSSPRDSTSSTDDRSPVEQSDASPSADLPEFHADPDAAAPSTTRGPATGAAAPVELTWDEAEQEKVAALAGEVMDRFARPGLDRATWWADLEAYLSAQAQADYLGVDPANVPVRRVTGAVELVPLKTHLVAIAHVPTDAGLYAVTLSRSAAAPSWVVERITPPERDPD